MGWLKDEFDRARKRMAKVPPHARPQWTDRCPDCGYKVPEGPGDTGLCLCERSIIGKGNT